MNLRPARMIDTPAIVDILVERQEDTRYLGIDEVDVPYAKKLISSSIQRHGGTNQIGCFVMVAEDDDGEVAAFVMGMLDRVYHVGHKLAASDTFLIGRRGCSPITLFRLFDEYLAWAQGNPAVVEIGASWNDALPGSEAFAHFYRGKGFVRCGEIYRLQNLQIEQDIAA